MEQFSPPLKLERSIAEQEARRFKGWARSGVWRPAPWDDRMIQEWDEADLIWVPSRHLICMCERLGADRTKFRVVRFPMTFVGDRTVQRPLQPGNLRVVFAGTLMLAKGVQYIYEALRGWNRSRIDMHFFGPSQLTAHGIAQLAKVGTVHGAVPRDVLMNEFVRSDVLLFPSLSEGSALVTAEAAGVGLPVIATEQSGPPDSAILIDARSSEAIRRSLELLLEHPETFEEASHAGIAEARRQTIDAFDESLANVAREALRNGSARSPGLSD